MSLWSIGPQVAQAIAAVPPTDNRSFDDAARKDGSAASTVRGKGWFSELSELLERYQAVLSGSTNKAAAETPPTPAPTGSGRGQTGRDVDSYRVIRFSDEKSVGGAGRRW